MDILFLKKPSEATLDASDLEFVRNLANQRIEKRNGASLLTNSTPGTTPIIVPVLPAQTNVRRRQSQDSLN